MSLRKLRVYNCRQSVDGSGLSGEQGAVSGQKSEVKDQIKWISTRAAGETHEELIRASHKPKEEWYK